MIKTKEEYDKICKDIDDYCDSYYNKGISLITDQEYDQLYRELQAIEKDHPEWVGKDSPTKKVGAPISGKLSKYQHSTKLYSLDNVFSMGQLETFLRNIEKSLHRTSLTYDVEMKYDGLTCVAIYKKGKLDKLVTRGDGLEGEDVTHNKTYIKFLPHTLTEEVDVIVKGEVLMSYEDFNYYNKLASENNVARMSNPRNAAAGLLRRTTNNFNYPFLMFIPYDYIENEYTRSTLILTQNILFNKLKTLGFNAYDYIEGFRAKNNLEFNPYIQVCDNLYLAKLAVTNIHSIRESLPFPIDGTVIKINDHITRYSLGYTDRAPKGAIAYKFPPQEEASELLDIIVQVGRLGTLTPVAKISPVEINGVTVSNVTLHNEAFIKEKDIRIGDKILITRRGDVIPHVESVLYDKRDKELPIWEMPKTCPSCNGVVEPNQSYYVCISGIKCPDQKLGRIAHYCSKSAMDIRGIAEQTISSFIKHKVIDSIADLYRLKAEDLALPGLKDTSIGNILESIKSSIGKSLDRFIYALGIDGVGTVTAKALAKTFKTFNNFIDCTKEQLTSIHNVGDNIADLILSYIKLNRDEIIELSKLVKPTELKEVIKSDSLLAGKKICFTGKFNYSREALSKATTDIGAEVVSSVSSNLDYLIVGDSPGSKLTKAQKLNIKIHDLEWLLKFIYI